MAVPVVLDRVSEELLEHSLDAACVTRPAVGQILYANPAACALFGYTLEELRALGRAVIVDLSDPRVAEAVARRDADGHARGVIPMKRKDGSTFTAEVSSANYVTADGDTRSSLFIRDISAQEAREEELRRANAELSRALAEVATLRELLPMCAWCRRVSDAGDYWQRLETYMESRGQVKFTHGICPSCKTEHFGSELG